MLNGCSLSFVSRQDYVRVKLSPVFFCFLAGLLTPAAPLQPLLLRAGSCRCCLLKIFLAGLSWAIATHDVIQTQPSSSSPPSPLPLTCRQKSAPQQSPAACLCVFYFFLLASVTCLFCSSFFSCV